MMFIFSLLTVLRLYGFYEFFMGFYLVVCVILRIHDIEHAVF